MLYSAPMARQFLLFILTVVALQFSWLAISAYCGHESGRAAQHFGHHQHTAHADDATVAVKDKSPSLTKKLTPHTDCSSCSPAPLAPASQDMALGHGLLAQVSHGMPLSAPASAYSPPPERPQWHAAA